jgi:hypothetical protein
MASGFCCHDFSSVASVETGSCTSCTSCTGDLASDSTLTSQEKLDCVKEKTGLSGGALAGIVVGIAVGFAVAMYCICKLLFSGEEEAGKASAGDVEAGSNDSERRKVLEKRLAYVRNQMPEEQS